MQRIDGPTASPSLPAPAAVSGTPGYFTGGDPAVPIAPTQVTADFLNMLQEELVAVVLAAGLTLSKSNRGQVAAAIQALIASGGVAFSTDAEAIAGSITNKAVSPHAAAALVLDRITSLIGGAPTALNTLKKFADAIGDDPNYAATAAAALATRALASVQITGSGLATGGGPLSDNRQITVPKATAADVAAGSDDTKAVTPAGLAGGVGLIKRGSVPGTLAPGVYSVLFPAAFPNACTNVQLTGINLSGSAAIDTWPQLQSRNASGFSYVIQTSQTGGAVNLDGMDWLAFGN